MAVETKMRSLKLYAILSSLLRFKPKNLLKQVIDKNGFEVWRQLLSYFLASNEGKIDSVAFRDHESPRFLSIVLFVNRSRVWTA